MTERGPLQPWEQQLRDAAGALPYPPTPDIARGVSARLRSERDQRGIPGRAPSPRLRVALVVLALFSVSLLAVPDVRATIGSWLRIGAVEIVFPTPTPLEAPAEQPLMPPTELPELATSILTTPIAPVEPEAPRTATPASRPTATPLASVLDLLGEMSLEQARTRVPFPVKVPSYPEDLGPPDRVFVQEFDGPIVVLVWTEPGAPDRVRMSLHLLDEDIFAQKFANDTVRVAETTVHGERALWVIGPHLINFYQRKTTSSNQRLVVGHVLIWEDRGVTYRLETESPLEEAVRIAESLR